MWFTFIKTILGPVWSLVATGGAIAMIVGGIWIHGEHYGAKRVQAKWDAAIARDIVENGKARTDAEKQIENNPKGVDRDPNNRDNR